MNNYIQLSDYWFSNRLCRLYRSNPNKVSFPEIINNQQSNNQLQFKIIATEQTGWCFKYWNITHRCIDSSYFGQNWGLKKCFQTLIEFIHGVQWPNAQIWFNAIQTTAHSETRRFWKNLFQKTDILFRYLSYSTIINVKYLFSKRNTFNKILEFQKSIILIKKMQCTRVTFTEISKTSIILARCHCSWKSATQNRPIVR